MSFNNKQLLLFNGDESLYHSALEDFEGQTLKGDEQNDEGEDEENYYTYLHESRMHSFDYYSTL